MCTPGNKLKCMFISLFVISLMLFLSGLIYLTENNCDPNIGYSICLGLMGSGTGLFVSTILTIMIMTFIVKANSRPTNNLKYILIFIPKIIIAIILLIAGSQCIAPENSNNTKKTGHFLLGAAFAVLANVIVSLLFTHFVINELLP